MTIETALQADRADLAVADWLQARMLGELPEIVSHAVKVDYFLSLVMMDGLKLAVDNNQDEVLAIIDAFRAVGLEQQARWIDEAVEEGDVDAVEQAFFARAGQVERANHAFIRTNLSAFQALD